MHAPGRSIVSTLLARGLPPPRARLPAGLLQWPGHHHHNQRAFRVRLIQPAPKPMPRCRVRVSPPLFSYIQTAAPRGSSCNTRCRRGGSGAAAELQPPELAAAAARRRPALSPPAALATRVTGSVHSSATVCVTVFPTAIAPFSAFTCTVTSQNERCLILASQSAGSSLRFLRLFIISAQAVSQNTPGSAVA